jgi:hypothetical protein
MDEKALARPERMDGKLLLVTNVADPKPAEVAPRCKRRADIERGFWVLRSEIDLEDLLLTLIGKPGPLLRWAVDAAAARDSQDRWPLIIRPFPFTEEIRQRAEIRFRPLGPLARDPHRSLAASFSGLRPHRSR